MRVQFERTGGIAGMRMAATVDSETLPPDEAQRLREMVDAAHVFDLPPRLSAPTPGADRFQYRLTVEAEGRRQTLQVDEGAAPAQLRPLLEWLTARARGR